MFSQDRNQLRKVFFATWLKYKNQQPLDALENQVLEVILAHPEYHHMLDDQEHYLTQEFHPDLGETNPFLHMSLHLGLREQLQTDRPQGIRIEYQRLLDKLGDVLEAEHCMMDCLVEAMWLAQKNGVIPDDNEYLKALKARLPS